MPTRRHHPGTQNALLAKATVITKLFPVVEAAVSQRRKCHELDYA
jgi:hypothetical protein